jgi:hypothetical protein
MPFKATILSPTATENAGADKRARLPPKTARRENRLAPDIQPARKKGVDIGLLEQARIAGQ